MFLEKMNSNMDIIVQPKKEINVEEISKTEESGSKRSPAFSNGYLNHESDR